MSLKLTGLSSSRSRTSMWKTTREGVGHNCSQRVMVPWRHFQAMRPSVSRQGGQSPRHREYVRYWWSYQRHHGNAGTLVLTHKRVPPPARATNPKNGVRLTQAPAGTNPTTGQAAVYFLTLTVSSSSSMSVSSWGSKVDR